MPSKHVILIEAGDVRLEAELNDSATASAIWESLPLSGSAQVWGNEVYFLTPLDLPMEKGRETVAMGDLGYWPPGSAFCIFFGTTPMSRGKEIRPASAVNVFGRVVGDATILKRVNSRDAITISQLK